jgi:hypothetical protein
MRQRREETLSSSFVAVDNLFFLVVGFKPKKELKSAQARAKQKNNACTKMAPNAYNSIAF